MEGTYDLGSVVFEESVPVADLEVGDVITYVPPADSGIDTLVTHRIIKIDGTTFQTQGDANPDPDPWTFELTAATQSRVTSSLPYVGYLFIALGDRSTRMVADRRTGRDHRPGQPRRAAAGPAPQALRGVVRVRRRRPRPACRRRRPHLPRRRRFLTHGPPPSAAARGRDAPRSGRGQRHAVLHRGLHRDQRGPGDGHRGQRLDPADRGDDRPGQPALRHRHARRHRLRRPLVGRLGRHPARPRRLGRLDHDLHGHRRAVLLLVGDHRGRRRHLAAARRGHRHRGLLRDLVRRLHHRGQHRDRHAGPRRRRGPRQRAARASP